MGKESRIIRGSTSSLLHGRKIVIVGTASSALYKIIDLSRLLIRHGAEVKIVLSPRASRLVSPELFRWATGDEVILRPSGLVEYIDLSEWCDLCVVAPCTLNTMSKIVHGLTDNIVTLTVHSALGSGKQVLVVPCMNVKLWNSPVTVEVLEKLRSIRNLHVYFRIDEDKVKFPDIELLCERIIDLLAPRDMCERTILVTAGATREHIDPVKYLSTPSSGLTGVYLAREAAARGARVILVHGYLSEHAHKLLEDLNNSETYFVKNTRDMYDKVREIIDSDNIDIAVFAAAPLDYEVKTSFSEKIDSRSADKLTLELVRSPKIIDLAIGKAKIVVAFKAEWNITEDVLVRRASRMLAEKGADIVIAHDVSKGLGFGTLRDSVLLLDKLGNALRLTRIHKRELARTILTHALCLLESQS